MSLHTTENAGEGNAVGIVLCNLGTHLADPEARFKLVVESMQQGKLTLSGLNHTGVLLLSALTFGGLAFGPLFRYRPLRKPPFNLIISNVPGPRKPLYFNGSRLEQMYPLSIPTPGQALNITVTTYVDHLEVGLTGCRRSVPHLQRLLDHLETSLAELEVVAGHAVPVRGTAPPKKPAVAKKTAAEKKMAAAKKAEAAQQAEAPPQTEAPPRPRRRLRRRLRAHRTRERAADRSRGRDTSRWSLWSRDSLLSIASRGSVLSIGSVGSALSIGSVGSVASAFSVGSAASAGSALSAASAGSVLSAAAAGSVMGEEDHRAHRLAAFALLGTTVALLVAGQLRRRAP